MYGSPLIVGSRSGTLIASYWASMISVGEKGYVDATHKSLGIALTIENTIREYFVLKETLSVLGRPPVSVVAFESVDSAISIYDIANAMSKRAWHLNSVQDLPGVHVAVTLPMTRPGAVDGLIDDLVAIVKEDERVVTSLTAGGGAAVEKTKGKGSSAQLYGVAGSLPDKSIMEKMVVAYLDTLSLAGKCDPSAR